MADPALYDTMVPLLAGVGLFSRCGDYELRIVARRAELIEAAAGTTVIAQGDEGTQLFVVLQGRAEARIDGAVVNTFGPGDFFGELSALLPAPRTSDVVATEATVLAALDRDELYSVVETIPGVARKLLEGLAGSLRDRIQA